MPDAFLRQVDLARLEDRLRNAIQRAVTSVAPPAKTCHMAIGTTNALAVGASQDVMITWPGGGFTGTAYAVEVVPTGITGKASATVTGKTKAAVTVRVTATAALSLGTQFIVHGCGP